MKLPLSLDTDINSHEDGSFIENEFDYNGKINKIHFLVREKLSEKHGEIYWMLYVEHKSDQEVAEKFGFKEDTSKRKTPRYKQINNLKKRFYRIASEIIKSNDLI